MTPIGTIDFIPERARQRVGVAFKNVLNACSANASRPAWIRLFAFPKCVLFALPRGRSKRRISELHRRAALFDEGRVAELWREAKETIREWAPSEGRPIDDDEVLPPQFGGGYVVPPDDVVPSEVSERVMRLCGKGQWAKAAAALGSAQTAPVNDHNV